MNRRRVEERGAVLLLRTATATMVVLMGGIVVVILAQGLPALSWEMISQPPKGGYYFGKSGGILNAILGSLILAVAATLAAMVLALPVALFLNVHLGHKRRSSSAFRFVLDVLWGIPSIVYGAFAFLVMIALGARSSLGWGIITVAIMVVPIIIRGFDEVMQTVPRGLKESSFAMGSTRAETSFQVVLRYALPGLVTAVLLAFGRAIGDAASVLFTAGYSDQLPTDLGRPAATLPLAIFFQLSSPIPEVRQRAYAAAVVLTLIVLGISLGVRWINSRRTQHAR
jgi:phosphate transport system permease protein